MYIWIFFSSVNVRENVSHTALPVYTMPHCLFLSTVCKVSRRHMICMSECVRKLLYKQPNVNFLVTFCCMRRHKEIDYSLVNVNQVILEDFHLCLEGYINSYICIDLSFLKNFHIWLHNSPLGINIHLILHNTQKSNGFPKVTYSFVHYCVWSFYYTRANHLKIDATDPHIMHTNINL